MRRTLISVLGVAMAVAVVAVPAAAGDAPFVDLDPTEGPPGTEVQFVGDCGDGTADTTATVELVTENGTLNHPYEDVVVRPTGQFAGSFMVPLDFFSPGTTPQFVVGCEVSTPTAAFMVTEPEPGPEPVFEQESDAEQAAEAAEAPAAAPVQAAPTFTG